MERTPGRDTGIFREAGTRKVAASKANFTASMKQLQSKFELPARLDHYERAAAAILRKHGYEPMLKKPPKPKTIKKARETMKKYHIPKDAEPEVIDAERMIDAVKCARDCRAKGRHDEALVHALDVGALAVKLAVRPFEPLAVAGRKHRRRMESWRKPNTMRSAERRDHIRREYEAWRARTDQGKNAFIYTMAQRFKNTRGYSQSTIKRALNGM